jgi:signal transduction histidine kinase
VIWLLGLLVALLSARVVADARRLRLVARAEHELRGPLTAVAMGIEATAWLDPRIGALIGELERARAGLADLEAGRRGRVRTPPREPVRLDRVVWRAVTGWDLAARRAGGRVELDWSAGPVSVRADRGRLAQALGNVLSNAVEHGGGKVRVTGRRTPRGVRIEVRDSGRGHGLGIAARAVREAGGRLDAARSGDGTAISFELPVAGGAEPPAAA